jgi:hypothetical protein
VEAQELSDTLAASERWGTKEERSLFRLALAWLLLQSAYQTLGPRRLGPG